jgi:hypothetical protein
MVFTEDSPGQRCLSRLSCFHRNRGLSTDPASVQATTPRGFSVISDTSPKQAGLRPVRTCRPMVANPVSLLSEPSRRHVYGVRGSPPVVASATAPGDCPRMPLTLGTSPNARVRRPGPRRRAWRAFALPCLVRRRSGPRAAPPWAMPDLIPTRRHLCAGVDLPRRVRSAVVVPSLDHLRRPEQASPFELLDPRVPRELP